MYRDVSKKNSIQYNFIYFCDLQYTVSVAVAVSTVASVARVQL